MEKSSCSIGGDGDFLSSLVLQTVERSDFGNEVFRHYNVDGGRVYYKGKAMRDLHQPDSSECIAIRSLQSKSSRSVPLSVL